MSDKKEEKKEIANPFEVEISYKDLLKEIPEGTSLKDYFADTISEDQLKTLESEIKYYKQSLLKPEVKEVKEDVKPVKTK